MKARLYVLIYVVTFLTLTLCVYFGIAQPYLLGAIAEISTPKGRQRVRTLEFSQDGSQIAVVDFEELPDESYSRGVRIIETASFAVKCAFTDCITDWLTLNHFSTIRFSPDGKTIVIDGKNGTSLETWDIATLCHIDSVKLSDGWFFLNNSKVQFIATDGTIRAIPTNQVVSQI